MTAGERLSGPSLPDEAPVCYVNGSYAVIADRRGILFHMQSGRQRGQAETTLAILESSSVSAHGVTAVLLEDSTASYISFFKEDGSELDWLIKTVMSKSGYLMDVPLSPEDPR